MRVHAIMLVRSEGDILAHTLRTLLEHVDVAHVLDTGSDDDTWDVVQDVALRDARVKPFARHAPSGDVSLRGLVFESVKHTMQPGDWIARVDADEVYACDVRAFLRERVEPGAGRVFAQMYEFALTTREASDWAEAAPVSPDLVGTPTRFPSFDPASRERCLVDTSMWFETRFIRYRRGMRWAPGQPNPWYPGLTTPQRIPVLHYRWRSPEQAAYRLALRARMARTEAHGEHWKQSDLRAWGVSESDPRWFTYCEGEALPDPRDQRHLEWPAKRRRQELLYRSGVCRVMDWFRKGWDVQGAGVLRGLNPASSP